MTKTTQLGSPVVVRGAAGNRIACQVAGPPEAPPVVLTSGIGCGPVFFKHIARDLAADHRVIYWDYRAHGRSEPAPDRRSYAIADHARDLDAVVRAFTREPPVMVGFSMGVQVIVEWARTRPDASRAFVFLLGTPRNPLREHFIFGRKRLMRAASAALTAGVDALVPLAHPLSKATLRSDLAYVLALRWGMISPAFSREEFDEFIHYSSAVPPDAWLHTGLGVLDHDAVDCWKDLRAPALYLAADGDIIVPARECKGVAHLLPKGRYRELEGRSHAGTVEAGRALAAEVRDFVVTQRSSVPAPSHAMAPPRPAAQGARLSTEHVSAMHGHAAG